MYKFLILAIIFNIAIASESIYICKNGHEDKTISIEKRIIELPTYPTQKITELNLYFGNSKFFSGQIVENSQYFIEAKNPEGGLLLFDVVQNNEYDLLLYTNRRFFSLSSCKEVTPLPGIHAHN